MELNRKRKEMLEACAACMSLVECQSSAGELLAAMQRLWDAQRAAEIAETGQPTATATIPRPK